jgi:hypothetical protein
MSPILMGIAMMMQMAMLVVIPPIHTPTLATLYGNITNICLYNIYKIENIKYKVL